jgi:hypothetical protein
MSNGKYRILSIRQSVGLWVTIDFLAIGYYKFIKRANSGLLRPCNVPAPIEGFAEFAVIFFVIRKTSPVADIAVNPLLPHFQGCFFTVDIDSFHFHLVNKGKY